MAVLNVMHAAVVAEKVVLGVSAKVMRVALTAWGKAILTVALALDVDMKIVVTAMDQAMILLVMANVLGVLVEVEKNVVGAMVMDEVNATLVVDEDTKIVLGARME